MTAAGHLIGTPRYVAPERIKQQDLTPASDLYSLGCCAYFMLTGKEIYEGYDTMAILRAHVAPGNETLPADVDVPPELRAIINRLLAKELTDRWAVASQVIDALDHFLIAYRVTHDPRYADIGSGNDEYAATQMMPSIMGPVPGHDVSSDATEVLQFGKMMDTSATVPRMEPLRTHRPTQQTMAPTGVTTLPMGQSDDATSIAQMLKDPKILAMFGLACLMLALLGVGIGVAIVLMIGG